MVADQDRGVKEAIQGIESDREVAETVPCMKATEEAFCLVVIRWQNPQGSLLEPEAYGYHVIATDLGREAEEVVWQYNSRAQMGELPQGAEERFGEGADALGVMGYNTSILQKLYLLPEGWHPKTIPP